MHKRERERENAFDPNDNYVLNDECDLGDGVGVRVRENKNTLNQGNLNYD